MNRFVLVASLALASVGCAAGVDDPGDPAPAVITETPKKAFSGTAPEAIVDESAVATDWGRVRVGAVPNFAEPPSPPGEF